MQRTKPGLSPLRAQLLFSHRAQPLCLNRSTTLPRTTSPPHGAMAENTSIVVATSQDLKYVSATIFIGHDC
jgi:hypothetical protein